MATLSSRPDTHIRKRPYQPSVASYFHIQSTSTTQTLRPTSPLSPPLPADTQASLLSVGMRVRKSVPEGYKTHKTIGMNGVPLASTAPVPQQQTQTRTCYASGGELIPFCGLHKTGGWAAQEIPSSSAPAVMTSHSNPVEAPDLSFSQSSFASTHDSSASPRAVDNGSRKRSYEEEAEGEMDAFFDEVEAEEAMEQHERPIARMRWRAGKSFGDWKVELGGPVRIFGEDDFEDAEFLAPMEVDGTEGG